MDRRKIEELINGERDYQDSLPPSRTDGSKKTVGDYITMLQYYVGIELHTAWTKNAGNEAALDTIRKVAAIAVRCMEEHGAPPREPQ